MVRGGSHRTDAGVEVLPHSAPVHPVVRVVEPVVLRARNGRHLRNPSQAVRRLPAYLLLDEIGSRLHFIENDVGVSSAARPEQNDLEDLVLRRAVLFAETGFRTEEEYAVFGEVVPGEVRLPNHHPEDGIQHDVALVRGFELALTLDIRARGAEILRRELEENTLVRPALQPAVSEALFHG